MRHTHTHTEKGRDFGHYFIDVLDWITLEVAMGKQATAGKQAGFQSKVQCFQHDCVRACSQSVSQSGSHVMVERGALH